MSRRVPALLASPLRGEGPGPGLEEFAEVQGELQPQPDRRLVKSRSEQLLEAVEPVQDRVPVQLELRRRRLDRAGRQVRLQRLQHLLTPAGRGIEQRAQAVPDGPPGQYWVLGPEQARGHL